MNKGTVDAAAVIAQASDGEVKNDENTALKDDPDYIKYFKMLKLGLPMGAVKNAMERDGVDSSLMDGDHNAPASASKPDGSSAKKREKDTHRRTRLHWEAIGEVNSNSVWAALAADEEIEQLEKDIQGIQNKANIIIRKKIFVRIHLLIHSVV